MRMNNDDCTQEDSGPPSSRDWRVPAEMYVAALVPYLCWRCTSRRVLLRKSEGIQPLPDGDGSEFLPLEFEEVLDALKELCELKTGRHDHAVSGSFNARFPGHPDWESALACRVRFDETCRDPWCEIVVEGKTDVRLNHSDPCNAKRR